MTTRVTVTRIACLMLAVTVGALGCGDNGSGRAAPSSTSRPVPSTTTTLATTSTTSTTSTSTLATTEQASIWPAAGTVFDTPEAVAQDFVTKLLGVPPLLGKFRQGDSRSGEIDVLSGGESGSAVHPVRSTLLVRQLGPADGWFVLAAANDHATIDSPVSGTTVEAGSVKVAGSARGFEGTVVVSAFAAGTSAPELDRQVTQGGSMEAATPYSVTLDLSSARAGETVVIVVRGSTGLETDPGDFGAVPVTIGG